LKGVVVEIKGKYAVALNKQGEFIKVRNNGKLQVGYEIDVPSAVFPSANSLTRVASIAAAFILVVSIGFGAYSYSATYAYINLDINPSIELATNIYDRIISARGINADGEKLLKTGGLKNKKLQDGIEEILEEAVEEGYLKPGSDNAVMLTVSSKDQKKAAQIQKKAEDTISKELTTTGVESEVVTEKATLQKHEEANERGISPGKMLLIEKLVEAQPDLSDEDIENFENRPVKDILKSIKEAKKAEKANNKEEKQGKKEDSEVDGSVNEEFGDKGKSENASGVIKPEKSDEGKKKGENKSVDSPKEKDKEEKGNRSSSEAEKKMEEPASGNKGNSDTVSNGDSDESINQNAGNDGDNSTAGNGNEGDDQGGKGTKDTESPGSGTDTDKEDKTTGNSDKEGKADGSKTDNPGKR